MGVNDKASIRRAVIVSVLITIAFLMRTDLVDLFPESFYLSQFRTFIYLGLFTYWGYSLRQRIIKRELRKYLCIIAALIVLWFLLRTARYFSFDGMTAAGRYCWYLFYVPMILIPLISLFSALSVGKPDDSVIPGKFKVMYIPAVLLIFLVLTNDFHQMAFRFNKGILNERMYFYGPIYNICVIWIAGLVLISFVIIAYKSHTKRNKKPIWLPFAVLGTALLGSTLYYLKVPFMYKIDISATMCVMEALIWESCITCRMISTNSYYPQLFRSSTVAMQITDRNGTVRYSSETAAELSPEIIEMAEKNSQLLDKNTRLRSISINGGRVYWQDDLTAINRLVEELSDIGAQIIESNNILSVENSLKKEKSRIAQQNMLYDMIADKLRDQIQTLSDQLDEYENAKNPEYARKRLIMICAVSTYIKRRTNLMLFGADNKTVSSEELVYCIRESTECLKSLGLNSSFEYRGETKIPVSTSESLYDLFENALEKALPGLTSILVNLYIDEESITLKAVFENPSGKYEAINRSDTVIEEVSLSDDNEYMTIVIKRDGDIR
jgi:hypothetical protein